MSNLALQERKTIYTEEDYFALPEGVRVELIDGEFYDMAAPDWGHQLVLNIINNKIFNHIEEKGGKCQVLPAPFAVRLREDKSDIVEPDITVVCDLDKLHRRGCFGAPDWIIEIVSPGNPGHDYVKKLRLYQNAGVREYWIVDLAEESVLVYRMADGKYDMEVHTLEECIAVGIWDDFSIDFAEVMRRLPPEVRNREETDS